MTLTVVGLGPGPYHLLTLAAAHTLERAPVVRLRTARHPTVNDFPPTVTWTSFDGLYESQADFDAVYAAIVDALISEAATGADVVYAVPGDPWLGESTVPLLLSQATGRRIDVQFVPGVSFVGVALAAARAAGIRNLQIVDALSATDVDPTAPLLIYQVHSPAVAADLKLDLLRRYPADHQVAVIWHAGIPGEESVLRAPLSEFNRRASFDHLTSVLVEPLAPESALASVQGLRAIVRRLRGPNGCPWDREQTHRSIRRYVIEEAYEVADAIDAGEASELKEELGDLLLQVMLHAQIADDEGEFDFDDVVRRLSEKLVGRHPHVFGNTMARTTAEVVRNWEALKRAEKGEAGLRPSLTDGIPRSMPALRASQEALRRAGEARLDDMAGAPSEEDLDLLLDRARRARGARGREEALGDLLFHIARCGTHLDVDLETALERANRRFAARVRRVEGRLAKESTPPPRPARSGDVAERV